jgi:eukaryotic-like serine/threonine-protein kinase
MIGRIIGQYEVVSQFGEGGMGELYLGRHTRLAREVIIKTIRTEDFSPKQIEHLRERLEREAFVQSQLDHPHIVRVYDFMVSGDTTCMVMEYVPGRDLRKMILRETGPIPASRAIHLFKQVLSAIDYAHNFVYSDPSGQKHQGIIHRDLKPANILVTPDDIVKVTDFGIVKLKGVKGGTQIGFNPGTPEYMSPEQAIGRELDQRSDNYSLGVVFYEMMTGRVPFEDSGSGTSDYAIRKGHIELPVPPPSQFYPAISPELERILLIALEKNPESRFQSAREFLTAIEEYESTGIASGALRGGASLPRHTVLQRPSRSSASSLPAVDISHRASKANNAVATINDIHSHSVPDQTPIASPSVSAPAKESRLPLMVGAAVAAVVLIAGLAWYLTRPKPQPPPRVPGQAAVPPGMVRIPGGEFVMGRDDGSDWDYPAHKVTVKPFLIDETELTNDEYQQYVDATRSQPPRHWPTGHYAIGEATLPVVNVNWSEASAYCASLGKRLPTEEEWEFAAKGHDGRRYPYGDQWRPRQSNAFEDGIGRLSDVRNYPEGRSPFGIFNMAGNAQEWTSSDFSAYPGSKLNDAQKADNAGRKVLRGGAYQARKEFQTTTERFFYPPSTANEYTGFRCARDAQ